MVSHFSNLPEVTTKLSLHVVIVVPRSQKKRDTKERQYHRSRVLVLGKDNVKILPRVLEDPELLAQFPLPVPTRIFKGVFSFWNEKILVVDCRKC